MTSILHPLIKANAALLSQKIALLDVLVAKHGANYASEAFQKTCPVVGASIGQHYRHSMVRASFLNCRNLRRHSSTINDYFSITRDRLMHESKRAFSLGLFALVIGSHRTSSSCCKTDQKHVFSTRRIAL